MNLFARIERWLWNRRQAASEGRNREYRWVELARYNSRVMEGIVHAPEYVERMRHEQNRFDNERDQERIDRLIVTASGRPAKPGSLL